MAINNNYDKQLCMSLLCGRGIERAEAIGIDLHESYMKFQLGRGTPAGGDGFGDGKTEERNTKPYL